MKYQKLYDEIVCEKYSLQEQVDWLEEVRDFIATAETDDLETLEANSERLQLINIKSRRHQNYNLQLDNLISKATVVLLQEIYEKGEKEA